MSAGETQQPPVISDSAELIGTIQDAEGTPVAGALVQVDTVSATTDQDGRFVLRGLKTGEKSVSISANSYAPVTLGVTLSGRRNILPATRLSASINTRSIEWPVNLQDSTVFNLPDLQALEVHVTVLAEEGQAAPAAVRASALAIPRNLSPYPALPGIDPYASFAVEINGINAADGMKAQVVTRTNPLTQTMVYTYDLNSNTTQLQDQKGQVTRLGYDALDRTITKTYADNSVITYTYDSVSQVNLITDTVGGVITNSYDNLDRMLSQQTAQGALQYRYDAAGRQISSTVVGQNAILYAFDAVNRPISLTQSTQSVKFGYDNINRRTAMTLTNNVVTQYGYDAASQLFSMTYKFGASTLGDLAYGYDKLSRRSSIGGGFARTGIPITVSTSSYDAANQLTAWGGATLSYDANGALTSDGTYTYTWDARNQLSTVKLKSSGATLATYGYDATGRRYNKVVNGINTSFVFKGANPTQEISGAVKTDLLTGGIDQFFQRGNDTLLQDALGSTIATVNSSGALQTQYTYEPFGAMTSSGAASDNSYQFTSRENDGVGGLMFYRARYYAPGLGRFVSQDPIGFRGGINLYAYVGNNPISYRDPSGLVTAGSGDYCRSIGPFKVCIHLPKPCGSSKSSGGPKPLYQIEQPPIDWDTIFGTKGRQDQRSTWQKIKDRISGNCLAACVPICALCPYGSSRTSYKDRNDFGEGTGTTDFSDPWSVAAWLLTVVPSAIAAGSDDENCVKCLDCILICTFGFGK